MPVSEWLPLFSHFTDAQILNPGYAIHSDAAGRPWCKLCDGPIVGEAAERHLERHKRDLAAHRTRQRSQALRKAQAARGRT